MTEVAGEGSLVFQIFPGDHIPPHVHVFQSGRLLCRIELRNGHFMKEPPAGMSLGIRAHAERIVIAWGRFRG